MTNAQVAALIANYWIIESSKKGLSYTWDPIAEEILKWLNEKDKNEPIKPTS